MNSYISALFKEKSTLFGVTASQTGMQIDISCHNLNFSNFWGGEWKSCWILDYETKKLNGTINVHIHFFEMGNIQFNLQKEFKNVAVKGVDAKSIVEALRKEETDVSLPATYLASSTKRAWKKCILKSQRRCSKECADRQQCFALNSNGLGLV